MTNLALMFIAALVGPLLIIEMRHRLRIQTAMERRVAALALMYQFQDAEDERDQAASDHTENKTIHDFHSY